jgi:hypothetical protein
MLAHVPQVIPVAVVGHNKENVEPLVYVILEHLVVGQMFKVAHRLIQIVQMEWLKENVKPLMFGTNGLNGKKLKLVLHKVLN